MAEDVEVKEETVVAEEQASEPKVKKENPFAKLTLENWTLILAIGAMLFTVLAVVFGGLIYSAVISKICLGLSLASLVASGVFFMIDLFKNKQLAFTPTFIIFLLAIFVVL